MLAKTLTKFDDGHGDHEDPDDCDKDDAGRDDGDDTVVSNA